MRNFEMSIVNLLFTFSVILAVCGLAHGQDANEAYWSVASNGTRIVQLPLSVGEVKVIRLQSEVPAGKTLKAYSLNLAYDETKVSVADVAVSPGSVIPPTNINFNTPGTVVVNGFNVTGVSGSGVVSIIDVTVKALAQGSFDFAAHFNSYGSSGGNQFRPLPASLGVAVK